MNRIITIILVLLFEGSLDVRAEEKVESSIRTISGFLERVRLDQDERQFGVRLTKDNGTVIWIEEPSQKISSSTQVIRHPLTMFSDDKLEGIFEVDPSGKTKLLGMARRVFDKDCGAVARVDFPTPLGRPQIYSLSGLVCDEKDQPLTQSENFLVMGRGNQNWAQCASSSAVCEWFFRHSNDLEAATQVSTLTYLWRGRGELLMSGIEFKQDPIRARSMAFRSNRSMYDAENRTLSYGMGDYADGLDAFVVIHEWMHSFIDDLNRGMYGYETSVMHEGLADYWPAQIFESPCFAPFDAQEVPGRRCVRQLENDLVYPKDMKGLDPHEDGQILSGALWELQKFLPKPIILEMVGESLIRLPKDADLSLFWVKMLSTYERMLKDRILLVDRMREVREILQRRGFDHSNL